MFTMQWEHITIVTSICSEHYSSQSIFTLTSLNVKNLLLFPY